MLADKIVKIINKTLHSLEGNLEIINPGFEFPRKLLIVLPGFIGDIVVMSPLLRNLRLNFGNEAVIDVIANPAVYNLVETLPYFDNLYLSKSIKNKKEFLIKNQYDTALFFNFQILWILASYNASVKQRVTFGLERMGLYYTPVLNDKIITHMIRSTYITDNLNQKYVYFNLLNELGLNKYNEYPEINLNENDYSTAENLLNNIPDPKILIHVTSGSVGKNWDFENWINVLKFIKKKYNAGFIATGPKSDSEIYEFLAKKSGLKLYNLCGKTTIRETTALYEKIDLMITLDTGPAHLAAYANTKNIIIIYGPTNQKQWLPFTISSNIHQVYLDLPCRPCITRFCLQKECLSKLSSDNVIEILENIEL